MPSKYRILLCAFVVGTIAVTLPISAADPSAPPVVGGDEGYTIVEETHYREVVARSSCRLVPETKFVKKTVYSYKNVAYCRPNCPNPIYRCGDAEKCTECECCARYKRVLVKREVVEKKEGFKCVVEEEKERVPYVVTRRVPCATMPSVPGAAQAK